MSDYDDRKKSAFASAAGKLWQLLAKCPRGKHRRSIKHIRKQGETYVSRCLGCGVPMIRKAKRNWLIDPRG